MKFQSYTLKAQQKAEFIIQLALAYAAGDYPPRVADGSTGQLLFSGEHFYSLTSIGYFRRPEQAHTAAASWEQFWKQIPFSFRLNETEDLLQELNHYLSRLEKLPEDLLESLWSVVETSLNEERAKHGLAKIFPHQAWQQRISGLRKLIHSKLAQQNDIKKEEVDFLLHPLELSPNFVHLPQVVARPNALPEVANHSPRELLWAFYFAGSSEIQHGLSKHWGPGGGVRGLLLRGDEDLKVRYFIGPDRDPFHHLARKDVAQLQLNPENHRTLLVLPRDDRESAVAQQIARRLGVKVMVINDPHYPEYTATEIIAQARRVGAYRIILMEIPGLGLEEEKRISDSVAVEGEHLRFDLVIVDHHSYGGVNRAHPLSSLEQLFGLFGYRPTAMEQMVGTTDSMMIWGLKAMGLSHQEILAYVQNIYGWDLNEVAAQYQSYPSIMVNGEKFYIISQNQIRHRAQQVVSALSWLNDLRVVNVLLMTPPIGILFNGNPRLVRRLYEGTLEFSNHYRNNYFGGNPSVSGFWGLDSINGGYPAFNRIVNKVFAEVGLKVLNEIRPGPPEFTNCMPLLLATEAARPVLLP
jgi:hypothetical protein